MLEHKYDIKEDGFDGYVKIKVPSYRDRMKMMQEMNLKISANGELEQGNIIESLDKLYVVLADHVSEVKVKYGEHNFEDLDELGSYQEGTAVINELTQVLMSGLSLSGKSKKVSKDRQG